MTPLGTTPRLICRLALAIGFSIPAPVMAQPSTGGAEDAAQQPGQTNRRDERRMRRERFEGGTPDERRKRRIDRMVDMTVRTYELDDIQTVIVRNEIEAISAERRAAMGADAQRMDELREKMGQFWSGQTAQDDELSREARQERRRQLRDNPEFQSLRQELRQLDEKYPFDWDASIARVEALLPEDQVKKGQERRAQFLERRQERRNRDGDEGGGDRSDRENRRARRNRAAQPQPGDEGGILGGPRPSAAVPLPPPPQAMPVPPPMDPWERHVREFIERHDLDASQANAAMSILKDVRQRAEQIRKVNAPRVADAQQLSMEARQRQLAELNKPIEDLFGELKTRLDGLLTAKQRAVRTP